MNFSVWGDSLISESPVIPAGFLPKTQGPEGGAGTKWKGKTF
jgi:hypothetical protein